MTRRLLQEKKAVLTDILIPLVCTLIACTAARKTPIGCRPQMVFPYFLR